MPWIPDMPLQEYHLDTAMKVTSYALKYPTSANRHQAEAVLAWVAATCCLYTICLRSACIHLSIMSAKPIKLCQVNHKPRGGGGGGGGGGGWGGGVCVVRILRRDRIQRCKSKRLLRLFISVFSANLIRQRSIVIKPSALSYVHSDHALFQQ